MHFFAVTSFRSLLRVAHPLGIFPQDVYLMIRRKMLTIFIDTKDNNTVYELKKMIHGIRFGSFYVACARFASMRLCAFAPQYPTCKTAVSLCPSFLKVMLRWHFSYYYNFIGLLYLINRRKNTFQLQHFQIRKAYQILHLLFFICCVHILTLTVQTFFYFLLFKVCSAYRSFETRPNYYHQVFVWLSIVVCLTR